MSKSTDPVQERLDAQRALVDAVAASALANLVRLYRVLGGGLTEAK